MLQKYIGIILVGIFGFCKGVNGENTLCLKSEIVLKKPGNAAIVYPLNAASDEEGICPAHWPATDILPVEIVRRVTGNSGTQKLVVTLTAHQDVYFHFSQRLVLPFRQDSCLFYLPGFWYRRNLRSPENTPSFRLSRHWTVREDRLSAPLTGIWDEQSGGYTAVLRTGNFWQDALTTHKEGEVILSGETSVGHTGFAEDNGRTTVVFGFPFAESPYTYLRKLTLAPAVKAFQYLQKGESVRLEWIICQGQASDYSDFIKQLWEYSYDTYQPVPLENSYTVQEVKAVLSQYFRQSLVEDYALKYYSGAHLRTADCQPNGVAEVGFIGRTLLNAYNAMEYGEEQSDRGLQTDARKVFDSYLTEGFTAEGLLREFVNFSEGTEEDCYSIRRQSEGAYALLYYLRHEKERGKECKEGEKRVSILLDRFLHLQNADGSFPRKFRKDGSLLDKSGGSTPSAVLPLVMGYRYFGDSRYLKAAQRSLVYLEKELISRSDYFSSTLDANCEDKEASLYASTAAWYMALVSRGKERRHYADLSRQAAYFALSWYYLWDVPFARGQMLGDIGLKSRGWGNVSVENNHIDVFVFEFADVLRWLAREYEEPRFKNFADVISSSMVQLLPYKEHLCGIAKEGYYPEVVQHTCWDYGKNGKGFYNNIFAPGWTVASLWELLTPGRAEKFLQKKK